MNIHFYPAFAVFFWCWFRIYIDKLYLAFVPIQSEKAMAPQSNTLAWKIPWAEEPGGLQSMGCSPWGREESDTTE